jgi:urease accessory protein
LETTDWKTAPRPAPGHATLSFRRVGAKSVLASALASSPLRVLKPRNHGNGAWVFLAGLGGGLVGGDHYEIRIDAGPAVSALLATQASTKVYRSRTGASQRLHAFVADDASLAVVPDPVVCFADARYRQTIVVELAPRGSIALFDGYTCGRSARGEKWRFAGYESRTSVFRGGRPVAIDAVRLDPAHGPIAERMGRFEVVLSLLVMGAAFAAVRDAMLGSGPSPVVRAGPAFAVSPIDSDGAILRVAAPSFESAARLFRPSFEILARVFGDDPFARKW